MDGAHDAEQHVAGEIFFGSGQVEVFEAFIVDLHLEDHHEGERAHPQGQVGHERSHAGTVGVHRIHVFRVDYRGGLHERGDFLRVEGAVAGQAFQHVNAAERFQVGADGDELVLHLLELLVGVLQRGAGVVRHLVELVEHGGGLVDHGGLAGYGAGQCAGGHGERAQTGVELGERTGIQRVAGISHAFQRILRAGVEVGGEFGHAVGRGLCVLAQRFEVVERASGRVVGVFELLDDVLVLCVVADVLELLDEPGVAVGHALHVADGLLCGAACGRDGRGHLVDAGGGVAGGLRNQAGTVFQSGVGVGREGIEAVLCGADGGGGVRQSLARACCGQLHVVHCLTGGLRLLRHVGELCVKIFDGGADEAYVLLGFVEFCCGFVDEGVGFAVDGVIRGVHGFSEYFADGGDEGVVDGTINGGRALVGDFRGDRARFFVDIVFQRRPVLAVGHDVGEILAEIGGDDDRRIAVAGLYRFHRFGLAHEFPAKLVVVFQRVFDLVAEVHFAEQGVVGAFVDVGHGNFDALGIAIRIPESVDVEPCVQRRNDGYTDHDDPGGRYGDESFEVTTQNLQYVAHCLPSPMDVRPCSRVAIRYS